MHRILLLAFAFLAAFSLIDHGAAGSNILLIPYWNRSHFMEVHGVGQPLVQRGHNVYVLLDEQINMPKDAPYKLITYRNKVSVSQFFDSQSMSQVIQSSQSGANVTLLFGAIKATCTNMVADTELLPKLMSYKFDIAIVDNFNIPCFYVVPYKLGIPIVTVGSTLTGWVARMPVLPSVVKPAVGLDWLGFNHCEATPQQSVFVRSLCRLAAIFIGEVVINTVENAYMKEYVDFPSIHQIRENASLHLINSDFLLAGPLPKLPHVEFVGGLTTRPAKKLESSLHAWMSQAANVVVVSFGSNIDTLPPSVATKLFDSFAQLPQYRFLFRFKQDTSNAVKVSSNVRLMDWLPQNDALGHNSTRLFVTHSGNNGQQEALYHGVPMLCFYIHIDQKSNAQRVVKNGFGKMISIHDFTTVQLVENITELIENKVYSERIKKASAIFHSVKHPSDRAADAVEHVLKFGGEHLRPKEAYKLSWWQFYMLDVFAVIYVITLLSLYIAFKLLKCLICRIFFRKSNSHEKAKSD